MLPSKRPTLDTTLAAAESSAAGLKSFERPAAAAPPARALCRPGAKATYNAAAKTLLARYPRHHALLRANIAALAAQALRDGGPVGCILRLPNLGNFRLRARPLSRPGSREQVAVCQMQPPDVAVAPANRACAHAQRLAVDKLPTPLWLTDAAGLVIYRNDSARRILHTASAPTEAACPLSGELWPLHVAHPDDRKAVADKWREARARGEPLEVCCRLHFPASDAFRWHLLHAEPQRNDRHEIIGWTATLEDQQEAHEIKESLRAATCLRTDFLRVASHELSTPLTSLQLALQLASSRIKRLVPSEEGRAPLAGPIGRALDDTRRLVEIVNDLLDIKRLQAGKFFLRRTRANLGALLQDMLARLAKPLHDAGCMVELHIDGCVEGDWDVVRLQQVFFHLLSNAIKYAPGSRLRVRCGLADDAAYVAFEDGGPGIPTGLRKKVFSLFERATEVRGTSGLGMGLYLCRRIVHAHNGNLRLVSRNGKGAKFVVILPRVVDDACAGGGTWARSEACRSAARKAGARTFDQLAIDAAAATALARKSQVHRRPPS